MIVGMRLSPIEPLPISTFLKKRRLRKGVRPRRESNPDGQLRRLVLCPLSYRGRQTQF
jgi:hypothetical protein